MTVEEELKELKAKHILTKEYLRRALLNLKKSTEFFDEDLDYEDFESNLTKFIADVKRRKLV